MFSGVFTILMFRQYFAPIKTPFVKILLPLSAATFSYDTKIATTLILSKKIEKKISQRFSQLSYSQEVK